MDYKEVTKQIARNLGFEPREDQIGEYIYFENNPSDPNLYHDHNGRYGDKTVFSGEPRLTKEILEKIVRDFIPVSVKWSKTEKKIICTTLPCPCCAISMYVKVSCSGFNLHKEEPLSIDGLYRITVEPHENGSILGIIVVRMEEAKIERKEVRL